MGSTTLGVPFLAGVSAVTQIQHNDSHLQRSGTSLIGISRSQQRSCLYFCCFSINSRVEVNGAADARFNGTILSTIDFTKVEGLAEGIRITNLIKEDDISVTESSKK